MQRDFKFKKSWHDAISLISDPAVKAEVTLAIIRYGVSGEVTSGLSGMAQMVMAIVMPEIDADIRSSAARSRHRKESPQPEADAAQLTAEVAAAGASCMPPGEQASGKEGGEVALAGVGQYGHDGSAGIGRHGGQAQGGGHGGT